MGSPDIATGVLAPLAVLAVMLTIGVYAEIKESRIPNWLTISGMGLGLALGYLQLSPRLTLISSLIGLCTGFGFLFLFYVFGGIGGGDVKLMGASGALLGAPLIGSALFYTAIVGGFMALMVLIWRQSLWAGLKKGMGMLVRRKKPEEVASEEAEPVTTIPYGLAIASGCLLALLFGR
jgi:prepilin peptidase CpaA